MGGGESPVSLDWHECMALSRTIGVRLMAGVILDRIR
jgi:hypothetical protein